MKLGAGAHVDSSQEARLGQVSRAASGYSAHLGIAVVQSASLAPATRSGPTAQSVI